MKYLKKYEGTAVGTQVQTAQSQPEPVQRIMAQTTPYTEVVSRLKKINFTNPDAKTEEWIKTLQGDPSNDSITLSEVTPVAATKMLPTQNEIDFTKSLSFPLSKVAPEATLQSTPTEPVKYTNANMELILAEIGGKYYIIDGHHRWSGAYLVNRNCSLNCYILSGFKNPTEALKATQLAITKACAAKKLNIPEAQTDKNAINILNTSVDEDSFKQKVITTIQSGPIEDKVLFAFEKYAKDDKGNPIYTLSDEQKNLIANKDANAGGVNVGGESGADTVSETRIIKSFNRFKMFESTFDHGAQTGNKFDNALQAIATYIWNNVLFMRQNNPMQLPHPDRIYMPQTSGDDKKVKLDPLADVLKPLDDGQVNVKANYKPLGTTAPPTTQQPR